MLRFASLLLVLGAACVKPRPPAPVPPPAPAGCTMPAETVETDVGPATILECRWPGGGAAMCAYVLQTKDKTCGLLFARPTCADSWTLARTACRLSAAATDETL